MVKAFTGTVHKFVLGAEPRFVVDPKTIPAGIRDELCMRNNYWLDSKIGPNQHVAHYDLTRQNWRDMRNAIRIETFENRLIQYNPESKMLFWA